MQQHQQVTSLWCGDPHFEHRLREHLCDPVENTHRYHPVWMPVRHVVAVLGNTEARKAEVVSDFCVRNQLSHKIVPIRYGFTTAAIEQIKETLHKEQRDDLAVLILDHADVLALEPDDVETQRFALQLEALALEHAIFIVGCFDRILKGAADTYMRHFWRPWAASVLYLSPPHSTWIAAWLQTHLEGYVKHHPHLKLEISEGEYTVLAQHCVGASYGHLVDWTQRILYYANQNANTPITKDLLCGPPFMYGGNRGLHIVSTDVRRDESNFSMAVGQGPTVTEPVVAPEPEPEQKRPKLMEEEEEAASPPAFSPTSPPPLPGDDLLLKDAVFEGPQSPCVCHFIGDGVPKHN